MIINVTTIAIRQKNYLDRTLASLLESDGRDLQVNLILGSSDTSHVEQYRDRFTIVPWDDESQARFRPWAPRYNCSLNALRSLRYGDDEQCLCCEDDIRFVKDWYHQLMLTIEQIGDADYLLNLGQGRDQSPDKRYATHGQGALVGAQAIFYPSKPLRAAVAQYLEENLDGGCNDAVVGRYAKRYAALYNTTPMLIHHIGGTSSFTQSGPPVPRPPRPPRPAAPSVAPAAAPRPLAPQRTREARRAAAETVVALVRASLGSGPLPEAVRAAHCDWKGIDLAASHHGLLPIVYRALRDEVGVVPPATLKRFKTHYVGVVLQQQLARAEIEEIGAALARDRVRFVVTDGATLLHDRSDDPSLDSVPHLGVLVEEADVEGADLALRRLGYDSADDLAGPGSQPSRIRRAYWRLQPESIGVELQWALVEPYQPYRFDLDVIRARARSAPGLPPELRVMAPEHELSHLCLRLARSAVAVRSLIGESDWFELLLLSRDTNRLLPIHDIAACLRREQARIDWDALVETAERWAIDGHLHATLELCQRLLGVGPPAEVLRRLDRNRPSIAEAIAQRALIAADRADEAEAMHAPRGRGLAQWSMPLLQASRAWTFLVPPRRYLRGRYPDAPALAARGRHLRSVLPELWREVGYRLRRRAAPPS